MRCLPIVLCATVALAACSEPAPGGPQMEVKASAPASEPVPVPVPEQTGVVDSGAAPAEAPPIRLGRPVLLDFSRDHCLPCDLMRPWLDELRERHAGRIEVVEVNIDREENRQLAVFFRARAVPLQVYLDADGKELARSAGVATLAQMQAQLRRLGLSKE